MQNEGDTNSNKRVNQNNNLFRNILVVRSFLLVRILIMLTSMTGFVILLYTTIPFSCQLMLFQNIIMVFIIVSIISMKVELKSVRQRVAFGIKTGIVIGAIPATIYQIIDAVQYYYLGHRELVYEITGEIAPPLRINGLLAGIGGRVVVWILLIILSSFCGLLATLLFARQDNTWYRKYIFFFLNNDFYNIEISIFLSIGNEYLRIKIERII